jgi:opacity protein-like surface antigen
MTRTSPQLVLSLLLLAGATGSALAGDLRYGSIKDDYYGGGVPVPAPVPIPNYRPDWYLRTDFGYGMGAQPSNSISGQTLGADAAAPFAVGCCLTDDFDGVFTGGIGAGFYWSSRVRSDITAEFRGQNEINIYNSYDYLKYGWSGAPLTWNPVDAPNDLRVFGNVNDKTSIKGGLFMFNSYYDFANFGPITPYVGGGFGVAVNTITRSQTISEYECSTVTDPSCAAATGRPGASASASVTTFSLAGSAMAGFSYHLTKSTLLDLNYRLLWLEGTHIDMAINGQASRLEIGDSFSHQLRAGLRLDID